MATKTISIQVEENLFNKAEQKCKGNLSHLVEGLIVEYLSSQKKKELEKEYKNYYVTLNEEEQKNEKAMLEQFQYSDFETLAKIDQEEKG